MKKQLLKVEDLEKKINETKDNLRMFVVYSSVFPKRLLDEYPDFLSLIDEDTKIYMDEENETVMTVEDCPLIVYKSMLEDMSKEDPGKAINKLVPIALVDGKNDIIYRASDFFPIPNNNKHIKIMTNNNLDVNQLSTEEILGFEHFDEFIKMCSDIQTDKTKIIMSPSSQDVFINDLSKDYERRYLVIDTNNKLKEIKREA